MIKLQWLCLAFTFYLHEFIWVDFTNINVLLAMNHD